MGKKKSSNLELEKRLRVVQEWLMQGYDTPDIVRQITTKWEVTERQAYKYIEKAFEEFKARSERRMEFLRAYHTSTRKKLFRDLAAKNTPEGAKAALSILQDIAKLDGLYVEKVSHHITDIPHNEDHRVLFEDFKEGKEG
ncbi:MAG: hypothetical protein CVU66_00695 [Deltaproteobacteria bacterium HGW-Deltaproteobacteria-23]|nr:MAG: hypothetical protein CVU66_00695 [Deltaproteobacteria bacterium HGW-Deltaproteobacteria-23]